MYTVENIDKNKIRLTFDASPELLEDGIKFAYNKTKGQFNIPGFRKGKVPRKIIELQYGKAVFFDEEFNHILPDLYKDVVKEAGIKTVSKPEVDVKEVSDEGVVTFTAEVFTKPEVNIERYRALTYVPLGEEVMDEEIDAAINAERDKNSRLEMVEDRGVELNDIVVIDFEGFVEGIAFEGGKAENTELEIGSRKFIEGFEEQLIGSKAGETVEVNVTFPEKYHVSDLAGKPAKFIVEIKEIRTKILPELNDDFAQDVSEFDTLDAFKEDVSNKIAERKKTSANEDKMRQLLEQLVHGMECDVPDVMIDEKVDEAVEDMSYNLQRQGMSLEDYFNYTGDSMEMFRERAKSDAEHTVKGRLALEKIAELEGIVASDEELDEEMIKVAAMYKTTKEKLFKNVTDEIKESIAMDVKTRKALEIVTSTAIADENAVDLYAHSHHHDHSEPDNE